MSDLPANNFFVSKFFKNHFSHYFLLVNYLVPSIAIGRLLAANAHLFYWLRLESSAKGIRPFAVAVLSAAANILC